MAIRILKKTLRTKKEIEWIYVTKIKRLDHRDKKTLELEKKWEKIMTKDQITNKIGLLSYQYNIPALSKEERATFPFNLTQVSSGGVRNPGRFLVGWPSQAHTMEMIPYWMTSFSPTKKKKKRILLSLGERVMDTKVLVLPL